MSNFGLVCQKYLHGKFICVILSLLYQVVFVVNLWWKEDILMHKNELTSRVDISYLLKIGLFILLITFSLLTYIDSHNIMDIIYCAVVTILFVKFLALKLYQ